MVDPKKEAITSSQRADWLLIIDVVISLPIYLRLDGKPHSVLLEAVLFFTPFTPW